MLGRALERGEQVPTILETIDYILAPLYMHALFGKPANISYVDGLVDYLLGR